MEHSDRPADSSSPDGWISRYTESTFRLFIDHPPPRPYSYLTQLKGEVQSGYTITCWVVGVGLIVAGWFTYWLVVVLGLLPIAFWLFAYLHGMHSIRNSVVARGIIKILKPHPNLRRPIRWRAPCCRIEP